MNELSYATHEDWIKGTTEIRDWTAYKAVSTYQLVNELKFALNQMGDNLEGVTTPAAMEAEIAKLKEENAKLKTENERLVRDNEWQRRKMKVAVDQICRQINKHGGGYIHE